MKPRPKEPRIQPLQMDELTEDQRMLASIGADTVIRVLVKHPSLVTAMMPFGGMLLVGDKTAMRDRELAVLRVAIRAEARYEWANHVPAARSCGVTEEEIAAVADDSAEWPRADHALLAMVDDLFAYDCISDETWEILTETREDVEIIELIFLIGFYRMMAGFLNSVGVEPEEGRPALGER